MASPVKLILLVVGLLLMSQATTASKVGCQDCLIVAKLLEHNIIEKERAQSNLDVEDHVRKLPVKLSEEAVDELLDNLCSELEIRAGDHAERLTAPCRKLMDAYRQDLDSLVFQDSWRLVRQRLCLDWSSSCNAHSLYDSGEL